jgi:hypothetical protein
VTQGKAQPVTVSDLKCRQIAASVVLLSARGHVTREAMHSELLVFRNLVMRMKTPGWVIDTSELQNFEPGAVAIGTDWFREFKTAGGEKVVFVSGLSTARMAAGTIAFAVRIPLVTCETLTQAYAALGVRPPPIGELSTAILQGPKRP